MNRIVYKYCLEGYFNGFMAAEGKVVLVAEQLGKLHIWIEHTQEQLSSAATDNYVVVPTGHYFIQDSLRHIGSACVGAFVWHVYKLGI
jgi:hypothetical protein